MKTPLIIKADKEVKARAQKTAKKLGIPLSILVNAYLRQLIATKEAHFYARPQMTSRLERLIGRVHQDAKKSKNLSPIFDRTEDLLAYLHRQ